MSRPHCLQSSRDSRWAISAKDAVNRPDDIHQTEAQAERFRDFLETAVPIVLAQVGGDFRGLEKRLRRIEPFCSNWKPVEEYLEEKGWIDAGI